MISSRNLTILLSFCFVSTSLLAETKAKVICPPADAKALSEGESNYFLNTAKHFVEKSDFASASVCMDEAAKKDPKNRDVIFYQARVKAFEGKHAEAQRIINQWPIQDRESREIQGDLAWYRGDPTSAEKWYRQNINKEAPASAWRPWLKALRAKKDPKFKPALKEAIKRFPKDNEIREMGIDPVSDIPKANPEPDPGPETSPTLNRDDGVKSETEATDDETDEVEKPVETKPKYSRLIDNDRAKLRAALAGTITRETQNQSVLAEDFDATIIYHRKSLSLGVTNISRDYGPLTLTDTAFRAAFGIGFIMDPGSITQSHETTFSIGGTPDADFTPDRFASLRHEIFFSDYFSIFGEIGAKWYTELYVRTIMLGTAYTTGYWRYQLKAFNTKAKNSDLAGLISIAYQGWRLIPEFYLVGGRDAASRPYLFGNENAAFLAAGVQLSYRFTLQWAGRAVFEERFEDGFQQKTLSLVLLWYER